MTKFFSSDRSPPSESPASPLPFPKVDVLNRPHEGCELAALVEYIRRYQNGSRNGRRHLGRHKRHKHIYLLTPIDRATQLHAKWTTAHFSATCAFLRVLCVCVCSRAVSSLRGRYHCPWQSSHYRPPCCIARLQVVHDDSKTTHFSSANKGEANSLIVGDCMGVKSGEGRPDPSPVRRSVGFASITFLN